MKSRSVAGRDLFTVAIVGCPNAGKSTLFNRLVGRRQALVSRTPGMTRDTREGRAEWGGRPFRVLDTAGHQEGEGLEAQLRHQAAVAIRESDACLLLVDARAGVSASDHALADALRRSGACVIPVANKTESARGVPGALEVSELGFGEAVEISAEHGIGMSELLEALEPLLDAVLPRGDAQGKHDEAVARIILFGRPNVGKSTLANALLGEERLVAGPEPGITRDSIEVPFEHAGRRYRLVDSAGLRRRAGARGEEEKIAVGDALHALRFAEVAVLLVDGRTAFEQQDLRLADRVEKEGRAVVFAATKWDLVARRGERQRRLEEDLARLLPALAGASMNPVSGLYGTGLTDLLEAAWRARSIWERRIGTGSLNRWLAEATARHPPPAVRGRRIRLRYIAQINVRPPTFAVFCSRPAGIDAAYRRFLVHGLRRRFGFPGTPIRLLLRAGKNPYDRRRT